MLALENSDEILEILDRFTKQKPNEIPPELNEYIHYVAKTGDTVYHWPSIQYLFREKLLSVIKDFHDTTSSVAGKANEHEICSYRHQNQPQIKIIIDSFYFCKLI